MNPTLEEKNKLTTVLFGAGLLILFSGLQFLQAEHYSSYGTQTAVIIFGVFYISLSLIIVTENPFFYRWQQFLLALPAKFSLSAGKFGALIVSLPVAYLTYLASGDQTLMKSPELAITTWLGGILLAIWAGWQTQSELKLPSRKTVYTLLAVLALALLPRIIFSESIPIFVTGDEGSAGIQSSAFANGEMNNLFISGWYAFPSLFFAIQGFFLKIFGQTATALRFSSAIPGALTVVCLFWTLRAVYGIRTAWMGAIFLSFLHFHVHFSRIGLNNIWDGLWAMVCVGALWYGWTHERRNAYLLAGLALGLSQYFYSSGRILIVLVLAWLALVGVLERARFKRALASIAFMWLVALVVVLPLGMYYIEYPSQLRAPLDRVTIFDGWINYSMAERGLPLWRILLEQVMLGFGAYVYTPLRAWYLPEVPILHPAPAVFFIIGLLFAFFNQQKQFNWLIFLWLSAYAMIGALSESTPAAQRYVASAPAAAILVAIGLHETASFMQKLWPRIEKLAWRVAIVVALVLAAFNAHFYFFEYTPKSARDAALSHSMIGHRMGQYLRQRKDHPQIYFLGAPAMGFYSIPSTQYFAPKFNDGIDVNYPWGDEQNPPIEGDHLLFIVMDFLIDDLNAIKAEYPGGKLTGQYTNDAQVLFYIYEYKRPP